MTFLTAKCVVLASVLAFASSLHAGEATRAKAAATTASKKSAVAAANKAAARRGGAVVAGGVSFGSSGGLLAEAYGQMKTANHDYKGHRARAMHQVEEAARLTGERLGGDGRAHEAQGSSDQQLRHAQSLLEEASGKLTGVALKHVQTAIQHLSTALSVR